MTDTEFLHMLDKKFEDIQEADIKGEWLYVPVYELYLLCRDYSKERNKIMKENNFINPLNGID